MKQTSKVNAVVSVHSYDIKFFPWCEYANEAK